MEHSLQELSFRNVYVSLRVSDTPIEAVQLEWRLILPNLTCSYTVAYSFKQVLVLWIRICHCFQSPLFHNILIVTHLSFINLSWKSYVWNVLDSGVDVAHVPELFFVGGSFIEEVIHETTYYASSEQELSCFST